MIIVRLLSPERSWLVGSHQSLLGYMSRHCHGINFIKNPVVSEMAIFHHLSKPSLTAMDNRLSLPPARILHVGPTIPAAGGREGTPPAGQRLRIRAGKAGPPYLVPPPTRV